MGNTFKTAFFLTLLTLLLMLIGRVFGGQNGMLIALAFAAVMNFVSYFFSDKIALAMYRARPVTREELPRAYQAVERLTQKIGIPMPKIYVIPTDSPNAFATGRNPKHASVAVTQGILDLLTDEELEGVLAHELGHVRNRDILISSVAATIAGAITYLAQVAKWGMIFGGMERNNRDRDGGGAAHVVSCACGSDADPVSSLALARISSGRDRRALYRQSLRSSQRPGQARRLLTARADGGHAFDGALVHRSAAVGNELWQPVLDPSSDCQAH